MRIKIQCDRECENFYKIFWELNKAKIYQQTPDKYFFLVKDRYLFLLGSSTCTLQILQEYSGRMRWL